MRYVLRAAVITLLLAGPAVLLAGCGRAPRDTGPGKIADKPEPTAAQGVAPAMAQVREPAPAPNQVVIDNFTFRPAALTVRAGTKVTWVNRDDVPHTATSSRKPRLFHSGTLDTDDQFTHVFATAGTYDYFCAVHPHMTGRIIVK
jgi:plastocyanin